MCIPHRYTTRSCKRHLDASVEELSRLRVGEHLVRALDHKEGALGALVAVAVRVPLLGELVICVFNLFLRRIRLQMKNSIAVERARMALDLAPSRGR